MEFGGSSALHSAVSFHRDLLQMSCLTLSTVVPTSSQTCADSTLSHKTLNYGIFLHSHNIDIIYLDMYVPTLVNVHITYYAVKL